MVLAGSLAMVSFWFWPVRSRWFRFGFGWFVRGGFVLVLTGSFTMVSFWFRWFRFGFGWLVRSRWFRFGFGWLVGDGFRFSFDWFVRDGFVLVLAGSLAVVSF